MGLNSTVHYFDVKPFGQERKLRPNSTRLDSTTVSDPEQTFTVVGFYVIPAA
jgi:hypothetical protein